MSKKKILTLCLAAILVVTAVAGASYAYLTDTDSALNTFTMGNVRISLVEQQRDGEGNLVDFDPETAKTLLPIVGSAQSDAKDKYGLTTAKNYVDKIVRVKNTGKNDAYVRVLVAVPAVLEDSLTPNNNILHWNFGNKFTADGNYDTEAATQPVNAGWDTDCVYKDEKTTVTIDGILYNVYSFTYTKALAKGETTELASFVGFYIDSAVDNYVNDDGEVIYTKNGQDVDFDFSAGIKIPVVAEAIQADGFESASAAFAASSFTIANAFAQWVSE